MPEDSTARAPRRSDASAGLNSPALAIAGDRTMPHDLRIEKVILGAMLREPNPNVDIALTELGDLDAFYSHVHREVFNAIKTLHAQDGGAVDLVSIAAELQKNSKLEGIGGVETLAELYGSVASTVNLEAWCRTAVGYAMTRRMIQVCSEALVRCYDPASESTHLIESIESEIYAVRNARLGREIVHIKDSLMESFTILMNLLDGKVEIGIPSGFPDLDRMIGGFKKGEMCVLAARPSIGKTSLALNMIRNVALGKYTPHPRRVVFFSLEMTTEQITRRMLCTEAQVSESVFWNKSFNRADTNKLTSAAADLGKAHILIDSSAGLTIAELRAKARRLHMVEHIDMVVIDYLQLMHADGYNDNRQNEVAAISSGIKQLAKDLDVPVLVLAQLNREVEKTAGASLRPKLSHLRESGSIEQDADIVTFLHRDRDEAKSPSPEALREGLESELIVEKNRNGQTGVVKMRFFANRMEFLPAAPYSDADAPHPTQG